MKIYKNIFTDLISPQNLFRAWAEFKKGKTRRKDVILFEFNLEKNIFNLHQQLKNKTYRHQSYTSFYINDPKQRHIHKATVRDRIVHHAVFLALTPIFEATFIYDSYSCRKGKGTHKGVRNLNKILRKMSRNNTQSCFALKCDLKKFFKSVNHQTLLAIIKRKIKDIDVLWLIDEIIESFNPGLPIGNLTSQLFANVYLNELDQFVKHKLKIRHYLRYTDDFVLIGNSVNLLEKQLNKIRSFLKNYLQLDFHPKKIILKKFHQGTDFLGYIQFPHYRILRPKTKRRILKKVGKGISEQSLQSYLGVLSHANSFKLSEEIKNTFWFAKTKNPPVDIKGRFNIDYSPPSKNYDGWMDGWMDGWK
ncbi:MAG: group II intron reverse transcriptase domain-containing protein [Parcubacteria group bacterium]|nr:group II intron reverse transcriptase domain-containing protein [Parcubacteria group bacterium]